MRTIFLCLFLFWGLLIQAQNPVQFVNPWIGTAGHGHTFPGAVFPFGMVQLSPDTRTDASWDGCSGYYYNDTFIYGFSHTHLSGTGVSDFGDILLMPMLGKPQTEPKIYRSKFTHNTEKTEAGYYAVNLEKDNILAELTTTTRVGLHRYTFPRPGPVSIVLDLQHRDALLGSEITFVGKNRVEGYRRSQAWAKDQKVYFVIEFSQSFYKSELFNNKTKAGFRFLLTNKNPILIKVALSYTSVDGARKNLAAELPNWDFNFVKDNVKNAWNKELNKIKIASTDSNKLGIFYSALYHCMIHPSIANDVDGKYMGRDFQVHDNPGHNYYSVFSLWDIYRALHPLLGIIDRSRTLDFIRTFLLQYKQGGRLPVWELAANETDCMIGYHSVSVIADAWIKGIRGFDSALALEAMLLSANENRFGLDNYRNKGYISSEENPESVSRTLEYAYDDWCIYSFANAIGRSDVANTFFWRSQSWKNVFNPQTGFMQPRFNGNWYQPFYPSEVNNHYTEANSWQYSFYVPQDVRTLISQFGGTEKFARQLDALFAADSKTTGREQADISGLIGQYAHGNEPSHHITYLYQYLFMPERTQNLVHAICNDFYTNKPDGLIGNEDCGQMSAWYVLSALGIYPITPGQEWFALGTPAFEKAEIQLENGNVWEINSSNFHQNNWFNKATVNGDEVGFISYAEIMEGKNLHFAMADTPIGGDHFYYLPYSTTSENRQFPPPDIIAPRIFKNSTTVSISTQIPNSRIYYYFENDSVNTHYYAAPFVISQSIKITAFAVAYEGVETIKSNLSIAQLYIMPHDWNISLGQTFNSQYHAGGAEGLIDGIRGSTNWRAGDWQGYQSVDFEATLDLQSLTTIKNVTVGFLQDTRSWILMPTKVEVYLSGDGRDFTLYGTINNKIDAKDENVQLQDLKIPLKNARPAKFVKIKAYNYGKLPSWHAGYPYGGEAFIFIDEIMVD